MYTQYEPKDYEEAGISKNTVSITLNLFFLRIMKEHCIFLEAGFTPKDKNAADQAAAFKKEYDNLLMHAIRLSNGLVSARAIQSRQFVTPYTAQAERLTSYFTGIRIDPAITESEETMAPRNRFDTPASVDEGIRSLNENARKLTKELADFKKKILSDVLDCRMFTTNYPAELYHIYKEAVHYLKALDTIDKTKDFTRHGNLKEEVDFWNDIMAEHNKFAAGRLDPTEENAIEKSRLFAKEFDQLNTKTKMILEPLQNIALQSLNAVKKLQDFQIETVQGILDCNIQSIILPLLADHHIRETAHYMFMLEAGQKQQI